MPDKDDIKIGMELRRIVGMNGVRFTVMSGVVTAVNTGDNSCTVKLTCGDDDVPSEGILLNVLLGNMGGVYGMPAENANCIVAEVDGPGMWELLKADSYTNVYASASTLFQFNDGSLGGLTKTKELQTQINKLNMLVSHLVTVITGAPVPEPGSGAASALQAALKAAIAADSVGDFSDIENKKITHG